MKSAFNQEFTPGAGGIQFEDGKRYTFEVVDAIFRKDVIANKARDLFPEEYYNWATNRKGERTKRGLKEKENLTPEQIAVVESSAAPTWGKGGDEKARWSDFYNFIVKEETSGRTIGMVDKENGWVMGGLEFELSDGRPGKDMYDFFRGLTGKDPAEKFVISSVVNIGTKFTATMKKNNYTGYFDIDKSSVLAPGVEPPVPTMTTEQPQTAGELTENGHTVMNYLKEHASEVNGQTMGTVLNALVKELSNTKTIAEVTTGWKEVKPLVVGPDGNVNVKA